MAVLVKGPKWPAEHRVIDIGTANGWMNQQMATLGFDHEDIFPGYGLWEHG